MGCWNGTCMISNLPIISGEKIKLVILKSTLQDFSSSSFCYPTDLMSPAFLPIDGEYNDYGMIDNINKDWNYNIIETVLKNRFVEIDVDGKTKTVFGLEDILKGIERGTWGGFKAKRTLEDEFKIANLCFVMIRQDVWDGICEGYKGECWNDNKDETDKGEYYISVKEWCRRKFESSLVHLQEFNETIKGEDSEEKNKNLMKLMMSHSDANIFYGDRQSTLALGASASNDYFRLDDSDKESIFKQWYEHMAICSFIAETRKSWMITSGGGSQSAEWKNYKLLNKIVDDICDKEMSELEEEDEE